MYIHSFLSGSTHHTYRNMGRGIPKMYFMNFFLASSPFDVRYEIYGMAFLTFHSHSCYRREHQRAHGQYSNINIFIIYQFLKTGFCINLFSLTVTSDTKWMRDDILNRYNRNYNDVVDAILFLYGIDDILRQC